MSKFKVGHTVTLAGEPALPLTVTGICADGFIQVSWFDVQLHYQSTTVRPEALRSLESDEDEDEDLEDEDFEDDWETEAVDEVFSRRTDDDRRDSRLSIYDR